jgi:hypothetical protein
VGLNEHEMRLVKSDYQIYLWVSTEKLFPEFAKNLRKHT